jgi:hypothetical protein
MKTAYATIKGFEVMRMFKKGQFTAWIDALGGGTEASFVNRAVRHLCVNRRCDQAFTRPDRVFATWGNCGRLLSGGVKSDRMGLALAKRRAAMEQYVGLDVSLRSAHTGERGGPFPTPFYCAIRWGAARRRPGRS